MLTAVQGEWVNRRLGCVSCESMANPHFDFDEEISGSFADLKRQAAELNKSTLEPDTVDLLDLDDGDVVSRSVTAESVDDPLP